MMIPKIWPVLFTAMMTISGRVLSQMSPACAGVPNGLFVRNSMSCGDYFYCSNEIAASGRCPAPYVFDAINQSCNMAYNVDCSQCSLFGIQNIEDPNDCRRYYRCVAGQRTHQTCGANLVFDPHFGDCNVGGSVHCSVNNAVCAAYTNMRFIQIGDPNDCSKYFTCLNGITYSQSCANGLYFNAYTGNCDVPGSFNFCQDFGQVIIQSPDNVPTNPPIWNTQAPPGPIATTTIRPGIVVTQPAIVTTTPRPIVTQPPFPTQSTTRAPTTIAPDDPRCVRKAGYFLIAGSCIDYVYCIKGVVRFEYTCKEGSWYNTSYERCVSERPVGC